MDERLEAGRHHLGNGERALHQRYLDESRAHFEAALLQFRGPDLRIGEAHALRGLARVEIGVGNLKQAENLVRESASVYQNVREQLRRLDPTGLSHELQRDAQVGEAAALVVLAEILSRSGRRDESREALSFARQIFQDSDDPSSAAVWTAAARLAMREGEYEYAQGNFNKALGIHETAGDLVGQAEVLLGKGELARLTGHPTVAEELYGRVRPIAKRAHNPALESRAICQLGGLMQHQLRFDDARALYAEALPLARKAADTELEGFAMLGLGDVDSRAGRGSAMDHLVDAARLFAQLGHRHGVGAALLRVGQHALRLDEPELALVAAEGARVLWRHSDPARGVGQCLRVSVKALRALREWTVLLHGVFFRAAVAGHLQPNALAVRDFYAARAPVDLLEELESMTKAQLLERYEALVAQVLQPVLADLGLTAAHLEELYAAPEVVEALAGRIPRASAAEDSDEDEDERAGEPIEESPPDEEEGTAYLLHPSAPDDDFVTESGDDDLDEVSGPFEPTGGMPPEGTIDDLDAEADDTRKPMPIVEKESAPTSEAGPASEAASANPYSALYEIPTVDGVEGSTDGPDGDEPDRNERDGDGYAGDEPEGDELDDKLTSLQRAPSPPGYEDLYALDEEDQT